MSVIFSGSYYPGLFSPRGLTPDLADETNIRLAVSIRLPFRLRVGKLFRTTVTWGGINYEVVCRNTIDISVEPEFDPPPAWALNLHLGLSGQSVNTDIVLIMEWPILTSDYIAKVRELELPDVPSSMSIPTSYRHLLLFHAVLNQFIVAYSRVVPTYFGGAPLTLLTKQQFMLGMASDTIVLIDAGERFTDDEVSLLVAYPHGLIREESHSGISSPLADVDSSKLAKVPGAVALQERFIHYEYMFRSVSSQIASDAESSILDAVVALEGAFASFVDLALRAKLVASGYSFPQAKKLINAFLKEGGITVLLKVVPVILLEDFERPTRSEVERCCKGITLRNQIMHVAVDSTGTPQVRTHDAIDVQEKRQAVEVVYKKFVEAIERRVTV